MKINIVDYQLTRKFVRLNNYIILINLILLFPILIAYLFVKDKQIHEIIAISIIVLEIILPVLLIIIYLFLYFLSMKEKGNIIITDEKLIDDDKIDLLSDYCLDLNISIQLENLKDKEKFIEIIKKKYKRINKFGNYITHKKTNEKYEIKLLSKDDLLILFNKMDICLYERSLLDESPIRTFYSYLQTLWNFS